MAVISFMLKATVWALSQQAKEILNTTYCGKEQHIHQKS